ncbi:cupredoxin domain-containing protein [Candidatus Peregrinibacteria bacterium]|nr:cupredoxin domain-containing protein [Candidatus Peregrinibacteria bacterium]
MDTNNQDMNAQLEANQVAISPDQTSMFADSTEATTMHIPHVEETIGTQSDEAVPNSTKVKILAALAIVAVAGYAAYWVQEPVQLRADVLDSSTTSSASSDTVNTDNNVVDSTKVAEATNASTASVSVDVSLFGFEPAVLKVDKGTTVVWTNTSTEDQTIIGSSESGESFASPVLTSGQSFSFKFEQDGTFEYYSTYNPALKATITVGAGVTEAVTAIETGIAETNSEVAATTDTSNTSENTDKLYGSAAPEQITEKNDAMAALENTNTETVKENIDLKPAAASTPSKLAKTGPAENMYALVLGLIAWFNRKKLAKVFKN